MDVVKALVIGALAAFGIATIGHEFPGAIGDLARWKSFHIPISSFNAYFSPPLFLGFSVFALPFIFWLRK